MRREIRKELFYLAEENYKNFSLKLLPGFPEEQFLGVRIPALRKIAKDKLKADGWRAYLEENEALLFEEKMVQAFMIGYANLEAREKTSLIEDFLPKIDNWSICDSFCNSLKFASEKENQKEFWQYLEAYFLHEDEYKVRFALVMALNHFLDQDWLEASLEKFSLIEHEGYYVKMANAWAVSIAYIKNPQRVKDFLLEGSLDDFTHNKALQKIRESYRVSPEEKEEIKGLKRWKI